MKEQGQLVADEVGRPRRPRLRVRAVERHGPGATGKAAPPLAVGPVVQAVAAPQVVGLPCGDAVLQDVRGLGGVVANGERDELLLAAVADELQEIAAGQPVRRDVQGESGRPRTGHRADTGCDDGRALDRGRDEVSLDDEPATEALVVTHPIGSNWTWTARAVVLTRNGHVVAGNCTDLAGEALERVLGLVVVADPVQRARLGVLGDQPGGRRHGDAAGQLLVHDGEVLGGAALGLRRYTLGLVLGAQAGGAHEPGRPERRDLQELAAVERALRRSRHGLGATVRWEGRHGASLPKPPRCRPAGIAEDR